MPNYFESLNKGLSAAEFAEKCRAEIKQVFSDLNEQLAKGTDGKLNILIQTYTSEPTNIFEISLLQAREKYLGLTAVNLISPKCPTKKLAVWKEGRSGYPCTIEFSSRVLSCEDRKGLENNLSIMLQDPIVGEKIMSVIRYADLEIDKEEK